MTEVTLLPSHTGDSFRNLETETAFPKEKKNKKQQQQKTFLNSVTRLFSLLTLKSSGAESPIT